MSDQRVQCDDTCRDQQRKVSQVHTAGHHLMSASADELIRRRFETNLFHFHVLFQLKEEEQRAAQEEEHKRLQVSATCDTHDHDIIIIPVIL